MSPPRFLLLTTLVVALATFLPQVGTAGPPPPNPNWTNDPTEGPSPNTDHTVRNEAGGECGGLRAAGPAVVFGGVTDFEVLVRLRNQSDTDTLASESYEPDVDGDWSGDFDIPPGLDPGVYPLEALCLIVEGNDTETAGIGGPVTLQGESLQFPYEDRSYTVVAKTKKAKAVEAEVSFTG